MLCPLCAKDNKEGARFCGNCGGPLSQGSGGDVLEDVLGLGAPRSTTPGAVEDVGLDDLFKNLAARQPSPPTPPQPAASPRQAPVPSPFAVPTAPPDEPETRPSPSPRAAVSGRLSIESIIASVPDQPATPPATIEEVRQRSGRTEAAAPPPPEPEPEPEGRGSRRERFGAPKAAGPPPPLVPLVAEGPPAGWRRAFLILFNLAAIAALAEVGRHLFIKAAVPVASAGAGCFVVLVLILAMPTVFDGRHLAKSLILALAGLCIWTYQDAARLQVKPFFIQFEPPLVVSGALALVLLAAAVEMGSCRRLPKAARWALVLLALASTATLVEGLAFQRPFDDVLRADKGLATRIPPDLGFLEPFWVAVNAVLAIALCIAVVSLLAALRNRQGAAFFSAALSAALFFYVGRYGILLLEARERPGLRTALARADAFLAEQVARQRPDLVLPVILSAPRSRASTGATGDTTSTASDLAGPPAPPAPSVPARRPATGPGSPATAPLPSGAPAPGASTRNRP